LRSVERRSERRAFDETESVTKPAANGGLFFLEFLMFTSDDDVIAIGRGVLDRTLPKSAWTHAAHFAAAVWMLRCRPDLDASIALPQAIRAYNESTGVANTETTGYHETITRASLHAARAFVDRDHSTPLFEICNAILASALGNSNWLLEYWTRSRLFSTEARKTWIAPDVCDLPW
jgi:hypothetical protein